MVRLGSASRLGGKEGIETVKKYLSSDGELYGEEKVSLSEKSTLQLARKGYLRWREQNFLAEHKRQLATEFLAVTPGLIMLGNYKDPLHAILLKPKWNYTAECACSVPRK